MLQRFHIQGRIPQQLGPDVCLHFVMPDALCIVGTQHQNVGNTQCLGFRNIGCNGVNRGEICQVVAEMSIVQPQRQIAVSGQIRPCTQIFRVVIQILTVTVDGIIGIVPLGIPNLQLIAECGYVDRSLGTEGIGKGKDLEISAA